MSRDAPRFQRHERFELVTALRTGGPRNLCDFCGTTTGKRAVFFERRRRRDLCARCAVNVLARASQLAAQKERRMLKLLSIIGLAVLAAAGPAHAWTQTGQAADPTATSFKIEKSTDSGVTWSVAIASTTSPWTYTGLAAETGLVLFRVSGCNAVGCTIRPNDGTWHNEAWALPLVPGAITAQ